MHISAHGHSLRAGAWQPRLGLVVKRQGWGRLSSQAALLSPCCVLDMEGTRLLCPAWLSLLPVPLVTELREHAGRSEKDLCFMHPTVFVTLFLLPVCLHYRDQLSFPGK